MVLSAPGKLVPISAGATHHLGPECKQLPSAAAERVSQLLGQDTEIKKKVGRRYYLVVGERLFP